jgi:glycerol transport system ATP-binding protein
MLELIEVTKDTPHGRHIRSVSMRLEKGSLNILLGPTLSGKTSLMRLMAGLDKPTSGDIRVDGRSVIGTPVQKRDVAMVYQQFINYPSLTVYENIASPLRVARLPAAEIEKRVREAAALLKLEPFLGRTPLNLSGGQQQRTAIARAFVKRASLVLLDEPLANLDYKLREELRDQLPQLFAGRGAIVVYATSEPSEALMLGGHTATIEAGRITQFGPTQECYRAPGDLTTARVFSDPPINVVPVEKRGGEIVLFDQVRWPARGHAGEMPDGPYTLGLRPHYVTPLRGDPEDIPVEGVVQITELSGSESVAHFTAGGRTWVAQSDGVHPYRLGATQNFYLDVDHGLYFGPDGARVA